jgi:hypothetical protein
MDYPVNPFQDPAENGTQMIGGNDLVGRRSRQRREDPADTRQNDFDLTLLDPEVDSAGFVLNYSVFCDLFDGVIIGAEILVYYDVRGRQSSRSFPRSTGRPIRKRPSKWAPEWCSPRSK